MQSMQSSSNVADSVKNKELLWTTLQESGAFAGLTMDQFQPVQSAFDRVVQQAARSSMSLSDTNKHIIREFMQVLRSANANANTPNANTPNANNANNANTPNNAQKKKKIEVVYRADDLKTERANDFELQLREKQAEMDSFLTLKKPTDVSFTDAAVDEDKPIGDEMSRLIAQELAARERELVQLKPEDIKKAQQWIGTDNNAPNVAPPPPTVVKKSVSFSNTFSNMMNVVEEHEMEQFEPEYTTNEFGNNDESNSENVEETHSILSKFKPIQLQPRPDSSIALQQVYEKLIELEQRMNANHDKIMAHLEGSS